jgi:hypothetical protein
MKALYVDAPLPFVSSHQRQEIKNNELAIPDRRYLMITNGEKKKKKMKLKKASDKKSQSQPKR